MKKYNLNFERDFKWYLSVRHHFNFDGASNYHDKYGNEIIVLDKRGVSGIEAFFQWDSNGKIKPTKHPNILHTLLKVKGSVNLHIKMYSEDRAKGILPKVLFNEICEELNVPNWFKDAVESQKVKFY